MPSDIATNLCCVMNVLKSALASFQQLDFGRAISQQHLLIIAVARSNNLWGTILDLLSEENKQLPNAPADCRSHYELS